MGEGQKVNFFIIGQPKSGTTALYHYLKRHPDIFLPEQKQLYHFAKDHNKHRQQFKKLNKAYYSNYYNFSFTSYINRFKFDKKYKFYGDITPDYFYSTTAPQDIFNYNPDAYIVAIIREPLAFLKSFHNQLVQSSKEFESDFFSALNLESHRQNRVIKQDVKTPDIFFQYSKLVDYSFFLKKFHGLFGDKFKVIVYEDFKKDNHNYLQQIFKMLALKPFFYDKLILSNISIKGNNRLNAIKGIYLVRLVSSLIPWKLKNYFKSIQIKKKTLNTQGKIDSLNQDELLLKKRLKYKVITLNKFLKENDILLGGETDLLKKWGYDKIS